MSGRQRPFLAGKLPLVGRHQLTLPFDRPLRVHRRLRFRGSAPAELHRTEVLRSDAVKGLPYQ